MSSAPRLIKGFIKDVPDWTFPDALAAGAFLIRLGLFPEGAGYLAAGKNIGTRSQEIFEESATAAAIASDIGQLCHASFKNHPGGAYAPIATTSIVASLSESVLLKGTRLELSD